MQVPVLDKDGKEEKEIDVPETFSIKLKPWLIKRAVISEQTYTLQPQGHSVLAGIQTTAAYYGAYSSYRTGRHMGRAIRPREKLGDGVQGKVRRIPSSVKGRRAHPHKIEKKIVELINKNEYQNAIYSAISGILREKEIKSFVIDDAVVKLEKTKDVVEFLSKLGLSEKFSALRPTRRKGLRRLSTQKKYKHVALLVVSDKSPILTAARNIPGLDISSVSKLTANKLAPGGDLIKVAIFSESAIKDLPNAIAKFDVGRQMAADEE